MIHPANPRPLRRQVAVPIPVAAGTLQGTLPEIRLPVTPGSHTSPPRTPAAFRTGAAAPGARHLPKPASITPV